MAFVCWTPLLIVVWFCAAEPTIRMHREDAAQREKVLQNMNACKTRPLGEWVLAPRR